MRIKLKFWFYDHYWWVLCLLAMTTASLLIYLDKDLSAIAAIVGTLISVIYFIQKQRLDELQLFRHLFKEFNERYDGLNEDLAKVMQEPSFELSPSEKELLIDYFNLCGEEYFFYQKGYIDPMVWKSWHNGMTYIISTPRIMAIWKTEQKSNSYYGLEIKGENGVSKAGRMSRRLCASVIRRMLDFRRKAR